jgi:hypothetical protein
MRLFPFYDAFACSAAPAGAQPVNLEKLYPKVSRTHSTVILEAKN